MGNMVLSFSKSPASFLRQRFPIMTLNPMKCSQTVNLSIFPRNHRNSEPRVRACPCVCAFAVLVGTYMIFVPFRRPIGYWAVSMASLKQRFAINTLQPSHTQMINRLHTPEEFSLMETL